jgi:hypothetical protein
MLIADFGPGPAPISLYFLYLVITDFPALSPETLAHPEKYALNLF